MRLAWELDHESIAGSACLCCSRRRCADGVSTELPLASHYDRRAVLCGGPTDAIARILAEQLKASLGQTVVVENIGGGGGTIATGRVVRAASDGYTLGIGHWGTHVVAGAVYPVPYNFLTDLKPVALVSHNPQMIVSNLAVPAKDLRGLIEWIKADPGSVVQGTTGAGSAPHVAGALLQSMIGVRYRFVPYRGGAPAIQDLIAGHINLMIAELGAIISAISRRQDQGLCSDVFRHAWRPRRIFPTVDEAGLSGFHTSLWHAVWAPAGTPDDVVRKINDAIVTALADVDVRRQLEHNLGQDIPPRAEQTSEALGALHKAEIDKWWPIVRAANIKAE